MPGAAPRLPFIPPAAPCGGLSQMLQVVLTQTHMPPTLRHFRADQGKQVLRVGGGLDFASSLSPPALVCPETGKSFTAGRGGDTGRLPSGAAYGILKISSAK